MPLATKYRPRRWEDLRGQEHATLVLRMMLRRWAADEIVLPTGVMLAGSFGSGKTTSARILAASVNCENLLEGEPCGTCRACRAVFGESADYVTEVDGATAGGVDSIRGLQAAARLSHSGNVRVIIVDECHAISREGFSALLKQLEEPPPNVLYVLVTTDIHSVPSTIESRCLVFTFTSIGNDAIEARLRDVAEAERFIYDAEVLPAIARRSQGALRTALNKLEQLSLSGAMNMETVEAIWPDTSELFARAFIKTASDGAIKDGMAAIQDAFSVARDSWTLFDAVARFLRDQQIAAHARTGSGRRDLSELLKLLWDFRIGTRNASPVDPTPVEGLWFSFYSRLHKEISGGKSAGLGTVARLGGAGEMLRGDGVVAGLVSDGGAAAGSLAGLADV